MLWPKKNSYKEFDNEKKFLRLENSPPPHNVSNGPSLNPLYHVQFRDIYPLRRSVAFKTTEFWPLNKVEKAL